jgi:hemerythrin-like domain-containing protein
MNSTLNLPAAPATHAAAAARLDLYAPIHKALRNFMCDVLVAVGRIDVHDPADLRATLARLDELLDLCVSHVHHENDFVHPAIEARAPEASRRIAGEHDEHLEHIAELRAEVEALRRGESQDRSTLALRLYRHLALFVAANFQHMHIEESAHNAALWAHYSDAELLQLHLRLTRSLGLAEQLQVGRWMLPALTPAERAEAVNGMKAEAPPEAFGGLIAHVRPHLDDTAWRKLARDTGLAP